jgi:hypothetical protein
MKTIYLDIFSGLSGDMFIGAMLDLGLELDQLRGQLARLRLDGYHLHATRAKRFEIEGTKFEVHLEAHHSHEHGHEHEHGGEHEQARAYAEIRQLIAESGLSDWVKTKATAVFHRLAMAEGKIHGLPAEQVHFHELGAVDSIVDIVGACAALEFFGQPRVLASEAVDGAGWVECAHGRFPLPAPATLEILAARGVPVSQCQEPHELITPTGAALLAEFVEKFGLIEGLVPTRVGWGVGGRDHKTRPNLVRAVLGETQAAAPHDWETDVVSVLETNLDDASPELLGHFVERAMAAGALDVCQTPAQMKKNRPGVLLTVLCRPQETDAFAELMLRHTSAFGLRHRLAQRHKLRRQFLTVRTPYGEVTVKIGRLDGQVVQTAPEFESCRKLAEEKNVALKAVHEAALAAAILETK